ncbi:MAG: carboxypeptidase regulatory-like domain-containing protein, partial [Cohnella sp.]|nr:carboxypeptidase regulatory-like domain-containing protein [Cohnella sp.]
SEDGTEGYAVSPATVTIVIAAANDLPTVGNFTKNGTEDHDVSFTADDFPDHFTDVDHDALVKVKIVSLPADGTLYLNTTAVVAGAEIANADLVNLKFTPNANWNGSTTFSWNGTDGSEDGTEGYAVSPATVTIVNAAVNDPPVVSNFNKSDTEAEVITFTPGDFSSHFTDVDNDHLMKVQIISLPGTGKLKLNGTEVLVGQEIDKNVLNQLTFTPNENWNGNTTFQWNGSDGSAYADTPATVTITVQQLEGWVGSRGSDVSTPIWTVASDKPMKLSAWAPEEATSVTATFTFAGGNTPVELTKKGAPSNGTQLWESTTYRLPTTVTAGVYQAQFTAKNGITVLTPELASRMDNNKFQVIAQVTVVGTVYDREFGIGSPIGGVKVTLYDPTGTEKVTETTTGTNGDYSFPDVPTGQYLIVVDGHEQGYSPQRRVVNTLPNDPDVIEIRQDFALVKYNLTLKANPSSIVGNGTSTSLLKAVLTDENDVPQAGVLITFDAAVGTFETLQGVPAISVLTNAQGEAYINYRSEQIEGIISQQIPVTATADDQPRQLYAQEQIIVTFEPTSIFGVIKKNGVIQPGVTVRIVKDFNDDHVIDFAAEAITDQDGKYSIAVPKGDVDYDLQIIYPITVGGVETTATFVQKAHVGNVTGMGETYDAEKTASGILLTKNESGQQVQFSTVPEDPTDSQSALVNMYDKMTGYLLDNTGTPVAAPFTFNRDGTFTVPNLLPGTYELKIELDLGNGNKTVMNKVAGGQFPNVIIDDDGEFNIVSGLIDPYGVITDASTNAVISGVDVELFYSNSARNIATPGHTPNTRVLLPILAGFAPNDNKNPQVSNTAGEYAWMVFDATDYYIIAKKTGYYDYDSRNDTTLPLAPAPGSGRIISVDGVIVKYDFKMQPIPAPGGGGGGGGVPGPAVPTPTPTPTPTPQPGKDEPADLAVSIMTNKASYPEDAFINFTVAYANKSAVLAKDVTVKVQIPTHTKLVNAGGGTVDGDTIVWSLGDLLAGAKGERAFKVQVVSGSLSKAEDTVTSAATIQSLTPLVRPIDDESAIGVMFFTNRYGEQEHKRYIMGYPDGQFKPDRMITRAEIAAIFARILDLRSTVTHEKMYKDVEPSFWAGEYIEAATRAGLFGGYEDGTFLPDKAISR